MRSKYTKTQLKKIEKVFYELDYKVRYEKGNFNSGYCIVQSRKIVIINKFFDVKGRISTMLDILSEIQFITSDISVESVDTLKNYSFEVMAIPLRA